MEKTVLQAVDKFRYTERVQVIFIYDEKREEVRNMKKDPQATAHALAIVAGVWYVLCVLLIAVSRASYMGIMSTWFHGIDFNALPQAPLNLNSALAGLVSFVVFAWVSGYFFAVVYNKLIKK